MKKASSPNIIRIYIELVIGIVFGVITMVLFINKKNEIAMMASSIPIMIFLMIIYEMQTLQNKLNRVATLLKGDALGQLKSYDFFDFQYETLLKDQKEKKEIIEWITTITEGNLDYNKSGINTQNEFYKPLELLKEHLLDTNTKDKEHAWLVEGETKFTRMLREHLNSDIHNTANIFLSALVKYIDAIQGAVYIVNEEEGERKYIELIATYAYDRKKFLSKRLDWMEGLVGQCIYENDVIFITDIPDGYANIVSGLGTGNPNCIIIVPVYHNEKEIGAFELLSFKVFNESEITFLKKIAENLGSAFDNIITTQRTKTLLEISEHATRELREQEMRLLNNEQDLHAAQEAISNKLIELQAESNLTQCIVNAINKSNASVEFDMYGYILQANQMFLSVMGYKLEQLQGNHEAIMLTEEDKDSEKYKMMWESLRQGTFITGEFIRKAISGKDIWIEATFNPIVDLVGKPYKIIMYANFTTELKEKENYYRNRLSLFDEAGAFVELDDRLNIIRSNQLFMNMMELKRSQIKGYSFKKLIDINENQNTNQAILLHKLPDSLPIKGCLYIKNNGALIQKYSATVMANKDSKNKILGYMAVLNLSLNLE